MDALEIYSVLQFMVASRKAQTTADAGVLVQFRLWRRDRLLVRSLLPLDTKIFLCFPILLRISRLEQLLPQLLHLRPT